jgi:SNF2 family DNA or RNA helicase
MIAVWQQGEVIYVKPETERERLAASAIGAGQFLPKYGVFRFPATPMYAGRILETVGPERLDDPTAPRYDPGVHRLITQYRRVTRQNRQHATKTYPWPDSVTTPWQHQQDAYDFLRGLFENGQNAGAVFSAMGTGKSNVVVALAQALELKRVLIVAPKSMLESWPDTFRNHAGMDEAFPLTGTIKSRAVELWNRAKGNPDTPRVFVTNYAAVWQGKLGATVSEIEWDLIVLDESQHIKSPGGKASNFLYRIGQRARYRMIMTGTPLHHSPLDVFAQYRFLDPAIFGTSFARFKQRYAVEINAGKFLRVVGYQNEAELSQKMYRIAFRVEDDVLDLPLMPPVNDRLIDLEPATRRAYDQFERDLVLEVGKGAVTASNVLVRFLRLQQITSGYLPLTDDDTGETSTHHVGTEKYDALLELLDEFPQDRPIVVFARFRHDLERINEAARASGRDYLELSGSRNQWREWQEQRTGNEVLGVQVASGSSGIDLTRSNYAVYYSTGFSLGDYRQSVARLQRPGQTKPVFVYHLTARNTIDTKVRRAIKNNEAITTAILDEMRRGDYDD